MKASIIATISYLAAAAMAAPAALQAQIEKRDSGHVYMCEHANWGGRCENFETNFGQCYNLGGYNWGGVISSIGPDKGVVCWVYLTLDCYVTGNSVSNKAVVNPGFSYVGNDFNDNIRSIKCYRE